ncbi:crossover junction endodeoxyribonuclease RuvC [Rubrivirga marina]|uniref:Crossover junction endodeoxyribonuclease RuvC n=1 Tax=Rubrivirga marina TaxID=1196024 RepID=A0A271J4H4_9BACT|nr:crossover junction endodeoxyribonuclease RuvC [Rubrivirga marina]PAP78431.1 crossover junction endodeoxyribonuclease RuvC [Rubrivirga marina]
MIVLGIDPGTRTAGFGVVEVEGNRERALDFGTIDLPESMDHTLRLQRIYDRILELADEHMPDEAAVEVPFLGQNVQSMRKLVRVEATVMLAAMHREIPVAQYAPAEVKKAVTGKGRAAKEQVAFMVRAILRLEDSGALDASDALAVALCHARRATTGPASGAPKDWAAFIKANPGRVR